MYESWVNIKKSFDYKQGSLDDFRKVVKAIGQS
jgi:hypothetical protein